MFGRIVHVATNRADVFSGRRLEDYFAQRNDSRRIVKIYDTLLSVALERFGCVRTKIDGWTGAAEGADTVECQASGGQILKDDGELVLVERNVGIGHVAVDEVEESVSLDGHYAVASSVAGSGDVCHARRNALRGWELIVRTVRECRDRRIVWLDLVRLGLGSRADDLGVRERAQLARVVGVLVGDEDLRDLLGLIAEVGERFEICLDFRAEIDSCIGISRRFGELGGKSCIDEDYFVAGVDNPVLQAGAVLDRWI